MITGDAIEQLPGASVFDAEHQEVGTVDEVFLFPGSTDAPAWAAVSVEGTSRVVPLIDASMHGDHLHVPYARDVIAGAPEAPDGGNLDTSAELFDHYGITDPDVRDDTGNPASHEGHAGDQMGSASRDPRGPGGGANDAAQGHP